MEYIQQLSSNVMILFPLLVWSFFWKGLALWRSARMNQLGWFIALLVINTAGILEIIYLIATRKRYQYLKGLR